MKKLYFLLSLLFPLGAMMLSSQVHAQTDREYQAALEAFLNDEGQPKDGDYYITTEVQGTKWYVKEDGRLTSDQASAGLFNIQMKQNQGDFQEYCFRISGTTSNKRFTNPDQSGGKANLNQDFYANSTNDRDGWERQVLYVGPFDVTKFAIRSCNVPPATDGWNDCGRTFWTYKVAEAVPTPCYTYDAEYLWSFETANGEVITYNVDPDELTDWINDMIYGAVDGILGTYANQIDDAVWGDGGTSLNMGEDFGQHNDWDTWYKFVDLAMSVDSLWNGSEEEDFLGWSLYGDEDNPYVPAADPNAITWDDINSIKAALDSMYQVILDSEIPYTPEDGYYRIFTAERYKSTYTTDESGLVDKAIAASFSKNHENKGVFATNKDMANFIWKLTKSENGDSILLQNVGMETYLSSTSLSDSHFMLTDDVTKAGYVMFDYAGKETVQNGTFGEAERDLFAMRPANEPKDGNYFHQNGHGTPVEDSRATLGYTEEDGTTFHGYYQTDSNQEQEIQFWIRTITRTPNADYTIERRSSDNWTSEWYLEPVSEEEIEELVEAFEPVKNHDKLVELNAELRAKVLSTMNDAKDLKQIKSAGQLSSPNSDESEGTNIGNLVDGDAGTFWHTSWHGSNQYPRMYGEEGGPYSLITEGEGGYHYLEISGMDDLVGDCTFYLRERSGADNDRPAKVVLAGANDADATEWTEIAVFELPNTDAGAENSMPFHLDNSFSYIRVLVTDVASNSYEFRTFWHAAEIQLMLVNPSPTSQFVTLGDIATALEDTYNANLQVADEDITIELYQQLLDAYNAFMSALVDPTELRNALGTYANVTDCVVEGTNPGYWADTEVKTAYESLYNEAKAYDKAGRYTAAQIHKYAVMLKSMKKSVLEKANGIETDKWYRFMYPTETMFDAYGFSKDGGDGNTASLIDAQNPLFGNFVTPATYGEEEVTRTDDEGNEVTDTLTRLDVIGGDEIRESDRLFFLADDEIEDKDASMFRFVEIEQEADDADYLSFFKDFKENMGMAIDMMGYVRGEKLITDASQFSSNNDINYDGQRLSTGCLIDGNAGTFWHTDYRQQVLEIPYLQVAFNEPVSGLIQVDVTRRNTSNGHVVRMYVVGSNDAENWTNIGYMETPYGSATETVSSQPIDLGGTYSYLRFILTNRYGTDGGSNIEFDPFAEINGADDWNKKWTYFHFAEFQIYPLTLETELSAEAQALQEAYVTANKVLLKDVTADDLAAVVDAYRAYRTTFNTESQRDILPLGKDKADPVYSIQNKATGLFVFVNGTGNQNYTYLKTIPTLFSYKALGYQRSLLGGKNLAGESTNNLHAAEQYHRFCTWSSTEATSNSGLIIAEAEDEYAAPAEFTFFKNVKPGRIIDWCHSVTLTPVDAPEEAVAYTAVGKYTVGEDEDAETFLAVKALESIPAGEPVLFIFGDTLQYDAEDDYVEPIKFKISGEEKPVMEGTKVNGLVGTLVSTPLLMTDIYFNANYAAAPAEDGGVGVTPCSAYLDLLSCPVIDESAEYDFSILITGAANDVVDGVKDISSAIEKVSQSGDVYSVDGKLLMSGANLNSLKTLGRGMYILNGVKVMVK